MEQHQVEYMKRNYPTDWKTREMTSYDAKMAHMVNKIREKYKQVYETRPHTILIEQKALIQQAPVVEPQGPKPEKGAVVEPQGPKPEKGAVVEPQGPKPVKAVAEPVVAMCTAITITTNKVCGRRAKIGGFCGLHCKK